MYVILILSAFIFLGSCATTRNTIPKEDFFKSWSGTWVNTDNPGNIWTPQKIVAHPDGTYDIYALATLSETSHQHRIALLDQWTDSKGNIWYTASLECLSAGIENYEYGKISDSGNTLELLYPPSNDPIEEQEPDNDWYSYIIYYRE